MKADGTKVIKVKAQVSEGSVVITHTTQGAVVKVHVHEGTVV